MTAATGIPALTPGVARPVTPMGVLAARLADLVRRCADTGAGSDAAFAADLRATHDLAAGLDPYVQQCTSAQSPALAGLAEHTAGHDWTAHTADPQRAPLEQEMLSGHVEGQLLKMLVHAARSTRVLDVGMFTGYSALAMAEALPAHGRVLACEIDADVAQLAAQRLASTPAGSKVDIRVGPAQDTLAGLARRGEVFDLVFLDADKAGYLGYLRTVLDGGLLAEHGVICVDNTLMQGLPWTDPTASANATAVAEFNRALAADPRVEQVVLAVRDGVTLVRQVPT